MPTTSTHLEAALAYAARGWAVFPLHTWRDDRCSCGMDPAEEGKNAAKHPHSCSRDCAGRHPHLINGLKDATTSEDVVRSWWKRWPDANIGVATGEISGMVVIDVDGPDGESSLEAHEQEHGRLPETARAITGGDGFHYLFKHPGERIRNSARKKLGAGLDVRGDGGYIVVAPSMHRSRQRYEWLDETELAEMPAWLLERLRDTEPTPAAAANAAPPPPPGEASAYGAKALDAEAATVRGAGEGTRNHTLNEAAFSLGQLVAGGELAEVDVVTHLTAAALSIGLGQGEIDKTVRSGLEAGKREPRGAPERPASSGSSKPPRTKKHLALVAGGENDPPAPEPTGGDEPDDQFFCTDLGNARRLVAWHGRNVRYVPQWGAWLIWDGRRWRRDNTGEIHRLAKKVAEAVLDEARRAEGDERKRLFGWWMKSQGESRLRAMVNLAATEPGIPVEPLDLDPDPWLLNVLNGTIDLKTGELHPHSRARHITHLAPVNYNPEAHLEPWERFLHDATGGDENLQAFVKRAVGYSLTGLTSEEVLFFLHGPGAAGKSTFVEAVKAVLGDYGAQTDFESFLAQQRVNGGGAREDIARLAGKRFVLSIEVDEGKRLAEGLVKTITGGDTVTARFLYRESFEFRPAFKLWLAANYAPRVRHDDAAMWRRILRLPFEHVVPKEKRNPELKAMLRDPHRGGPAILAWAVQGCLDWQRDGLGVPHAVEEATEAYRAEQDPLNDFLEDTCELNPHTWIENGLLWDSYQKWAREEGLKFPLQRRRFADELRNRGIEQERRRLNGATQRIWMGIGLADDASLASRATEDPSRATDGNTDLSRAEEQVTDHETTARQIATPNPQESLHAGAEEEVSQNVSQRRDVSRDGGETDEEGWTYFPAAIGECVVCNERCRSIDPAGKKRHPFCEEEF